MHASSTAESARKPPFSVKNFGSRLLSLIPALFQNMHNINIAREAVEL